VGQHHPQSVASQRMALYAMVEAQTLPLWRIISHSERKTGEKTCATTVNVVSYLYNYSVNALAFPSLGRGEWMELEAHRYRW
jgi:hypothetical protein